MNECPFEIPAFDPSPRAAKRMFAWWSWHPNYPYWSKSCWGGSTVEEARAAINKPMACGMDVYHNKLICEDKGVFTEIEDRPCRRLEVWRKIKALILATKQPDTGVGTEKA